jgi:cysteine-rich repeat protein
MLTSYVRCATLLAFLLSLFALAGCGGSSTPSEEPRCGDSKVDPGEQCDDGNTQGGDGCSSSCQSEPKPPACGDSKVDLGEQCDDGNAQSGDGCDATCQKEAGPSCGDGKIDAGEECDDGNTQEGDGCEGNCTKTKAVEVVCADQLPLPQGTCAVTAGGTAKLIVGTVLTPGTIYRGGQVLVDSKGGIVNVGCDCQKAPDPSACDTIAKAATLITCPTGVISPALINTHDHITFTQNSPYNDTGERYEHRHDWRKGNNGHTQISTPGGATNDQVSWGELRFLMGGATSTVGSGGTTGLLRNLDRIGRDEGLGQPLVDFETFPLGDSNGTQLASGCGYPNIISSTSIAGDDAFLPHVAEGINGFAENEFACMSSTTNGGQDLVVPQSAFIHSIGLTAADYAAMARDGTALIWSPRSNITLYGDTAIVTEAARLGVLIALGTDWIATGSMNMLRELRCADQINKTYYSGFFSDEQLFRMVTANAAAATATDDVIGILAPGKIADIAIFEGKVHHDYRAVIDANPEDVALVMRGGKALYGDDAVISAIADSSACDPIDVCGAGKRVCLAGELGKNLDALKASVGSIYPAFFCGGPPMSEPSCTPTRPASVMGSTVYDGKPSSTDEDGDGIPNATDNCPAIFNPIRPMDNGAQADVDKDGVGDACDACPLDANTTICKVFDANDADGDGVSNVTDNCPNVANPDQADADSDLKGDVCDPCPMQANPGPFACPALLGFGPALSFADVGQVGAPTYPTPLTVTLSSVASSATFVAVTSSDPASLTVAGGGVTILAGSASAPVLVDAHLQASSVTLTATFNGATLTSDVRVLVAGEQPALASLTPATTTVPPGGTRTFTVTLDIPAPAGGATLGVTLGPADAGVVPTTVTVPAGQLSATFDYVDGNISQGATVTVALGATSLSSTINIGALLPGLIINEVDYDGIGIDTDEFIEIYNGTGAPVDLTGYALVFVNGSGNAPYRTVDLSSAGTLADQQYLVVGSATVMVIGSALKVNFTLATDNIQNGSPDGVALVDTVTMKLVDALSYEGGITMTTLPGVGVVSLVEGTLLPLAIADSTTVPGSLCRLPNGIDTNNAATDWSFSGTPTPGVANLP